LEIIGKAVGIEECRDNTDVKALFRHRKEGRDRWREGGRERWGGRKK
jgi:hypothetical protein